MQNLHFRNAPSALEYFPLSTHTHSGESSIFKIWGFQSDVTGNSGILWCYIVTVGDWFLMLWSNILSWYSRVKQYKKTSQFRREYYATLLWLYQFFVGKCGKQTNQEGVGGVWLYVEVLGSHHKVTLCHILENLSPGYSTSYYTCI